jgi:hypothetical protein
MHPTAQAIFQATEDYIENHGQGPIISELAAFMGIPRNTIYAWIPFFLRENIMIWEPNTRPRRLLIADNYEESANKRPADCPAEYSMTDREWKEALAFFSYRCAWCGAWSNKLHKDEVARVFPWTDFGRNEGWTGIVVPACEWCADHRDGRWKVLADCLPWVKKWVEMNRDRYVYESTEG